MNDDAEMKRSEIIKQSSHYVSTSLIGQGIGLFRAVLMPVLFSPTQLGIWNFMNMILSYTPHTQLGLMHGLNKRIPLMKGIGDLEEEAKIRNSVFWVNLILCIPVFIGIFLFSYFSQELYKIPFRILSVVVVIQMIYYYYFSLLRSNSKFIIVSNGIFLTAILTAIFVITFAYGFKNPIVGGLIGLGLSTLLVLIYWHKNINYSFEFDINWFTIKKCFYMGFPILAIGIIDSLSVSIDRLFIAVNLDADQLGFYALGIMISGILSIIPGSIASVLYTNMLEKFSVSKNPKDVAGLLIGPMRLIWALMTTLICVIIIVLPLLINLLIPKYSASIPIVEMLTLGSFFMSSSLLPGQFLISINKQKYIIIIQLFICAIVLLIDIILTNFGFGLKGIAFGTIIGYIIYGIGYTSIALFNIFDGFKEVLKYIFYQLLPITTSLFVFMILNYIWPNHSYSLGNLLIVFIKLIIILSSLFFSLWIVNRDGLLFNIVKTEVVHIFKRI